MAEQHPFRFGVIGLDNPSRQAWIEQVRRAEALGYSTFSLGDHVFTGLAPISALASAAMLTSTIRIGGLTFANDFRNPAMLAREVATLDVLSDGRMELGIGSGYLRIDYDGAGVPLDSPGTRAERLFEAVRLMKCAFTEESTDLDGAHYTVQGMSLTPRSIQQPWPPFLIGGGGRRVLQFAAREADIVGIGLKSTPGGGFDWSDISPGAAAEKTAWVKEAAGGRWPELEVHTLINVVAITDDRESAARRFLDGFGAPDTVREADLLASPHTLIGSEDAIVETLQERRATYGQNYITVRDSAMEAFAPVVARLASPGGAGTDGAEALHA